jgi:putative redox protein
MEITVSFKGGRKVAAKAGGYEIMTDQPAVEGGEGSAPSPYMLFLASLATCGSYFVLDFCLARGIDPDSVKMKMDYFWDKEMKEKGEPPKFNFFIETDNSFDEKYLPALERAVSQCAVKKAIESVPVFAVKAKKT